MEASKLISVIIPVYNVENYLPQCLDSIINQSYQNLEIILIDDESPDGSGDLCEVYAKKDKRIKVIHQKNGGAASARNAGLKIATGEYLSFVDSDDYLELNTYEIMLDILNEHDADVIQCGIRNVYQNKIVDRLVMDAKTEFGTEEYLKRYIFDWTCGLACDKLFRRELFSGIFYETGHRIDDEFFTYQGIMNAKKIIYAPVVVYNYRMRGSSVMNNDKAKELMLFDRLEYLTARRKKIVNRFPVLKQEFDYAYLDALIYWSADEAVTVPVILEIQRLIKEYLRKEKRCVMRMSFCYSLFKLAIGKPAKIVQNKKKEAKVNYDLLYFD